ncbi:hypothetical protein [Natronomonas sp. EA1]|uniref:hypothetical protein n=1 Tax=Natronomonas sp. EA1 TaxID=3421655 RepID=UPI003EBBB4E6
MSATNGRRPDDAEADPEEPLDGEPDAELLQARIDALEAENDRLREQYATAQRSRYRKSALGLFVVGGVAALAAFIFPAAADVLFALAAVGAFGGVLTLYLTPERFVPASAAERVYAAYATSESELSAALGLSTTRTYVPTDGEQPARLFIPQHADAPVPAADAITDPLVATAETRGRTLVPTGATLFDAVESTFTGGIADEPRTIADQLADALTEGFELADRVETDLAAGRATFAVSGSAFDEGFDTPPASLIGVGFAVGLDEPVEVELSEAEDAEFAVTVRFDT